MNSEQLQRLMTLARKTGAPLIVTDPRGRDPMVLLGVDLYEGLISQHPGSCWSDEGFPLEDIPLEEIPEDFLESSTSDDASENKVESLKYENKIVTESKEEKPPGNEDLPPTEEHFYLEPIES